jgi:hypothetical protein
MKEEQEFLIQQKKKSWILQGLNGWLHGERPAPKPLKHEDLLILRAWFILLAEIATCELWLNLQHCRRPKQTFAKYASPIYEPGATKLLFFSSTVAPKRCFLSHWM